MITTVSQYRNFINRLWQCVNNCDTVEKANKIARYLEDHAEVIDNDDYEELMQATSLQYRLLSHSC